MPAPAGAESSVHRPASRPASRRASRRGRGTRSGRGRGTNSLVASRRPTAPGSDRRPAASGAGDAPGQGGGRLGQALGREVLGLAQVDLVLAAGGRAVGHPVGAAALAALLARGVGPRRRPEREGPGGVVGQPGEPGRRADGQFGRPASRGCLQQPVRHRGDLRHPPPHPDLAPEVPNVPNSTLTVEVRPQVVNGSLRLSMQASEGWADLPATTRPLQRMQPEAAGSRVATGSDHQSGRDGRSVCRRRGQAAGTRDRPSPSHGYIPP